VHRVYPYIGLIDLLSKNDTSLQTMLPVNIRDFSVDILSDTGEMSPRPPEFRPIDGTNG